MEVIRSKRRDGFASVVERAPCNGARVGVGDAAVLVEAHVGIGSARFDRRNTHAAAVFGGESRGKGGNV